MLFQADSDSESETKMETSFEDSSVSEISMAEGLDDVDFDEDEETVMEVVDVSGSGKKGSNEEKEAKKKVKKANMLARALHRVNKRVHGKKKDKESD